MIYSDLLREALDMLGACHTVIDGPNAGWNSDEGYYQDDDVDAPDCKVCDLQRRIREALDA